MRTSSNETRTGRVRVMQVQRRVRPLPENTHHCPILWFARCSVKENFADAGHKANPALNRYMPPCRMYCIVELVQSMIREHTRTVPRPTRADQLEATTSGAREGKV